MDTPATGSFVGSTDAVATSADVDTFANYLKTWGLTDPGSGERVLKHNPLTNVFGRVDAYLPGYTRLVLRHNYAGADNTNFSRSSSTSSSPLFGLTSNSYLFTSKTHSSVAELLTNLPSGIFNELLLNLTTTHDFRTVPVTFPQVTVRGFTTAGGTPGALAMVAGTEASSQGNVLDQRTFELTENLTIPVGQHHVTFGTRTCSTSRSIFSARTQWEAGPSRIRPSSGSAIPSAIRSARLRRRIPLPVCRRSARTCTRSTFRTPGNIPIAC